MRTYEYRLFVNKHQSRLLMRCLHESRLIYNEMLETVKRQYEEKGTFPGKYDLTTQFKGCGGQHVPATTVQTLADRLSKALKRFLACKALAQPVGFPRFKGANRWHSLQLRQYGKDVSLHEDKKHLIVPAKLGKSLKIKMHRLMEGTPKTVYLVLRADGHWYALIVCETEPQTEHLPSRCSHPDIGLDVGLKSFLTDSEGQTVENPRFTSQKCHQCGEIVQKSLSVRTHICPFCGYVADRDVNAAKNILSKARAWPSGTVSAGSPVELRSPRLEPWGVVTIPGSRSSTGAE